jgi:hypothetical protein
METAQLVEMYQAGLLQTGLLQKEIVQRLNRSPSAVWQTLSAGLGFYDQSEELRTTEAC